MKRTLTSAAIAIMMVFGTVACKDKDKNPAEIVVDFFGLTNFTAAGGTGSFDIECNVEWTISVGAGASWITIDPTSGEGDATITVSVELNTERAPRSAEIAITAKGLIPVTATVTQDAASEPDGSAANPFLVGTMADLQRISTGTNGWTRDKHYRQTANITLSVADWQPIHNDVLNAAQRHFIGVYDGGGFSISNLASTRGGLFDVIGVEGVVRNVALINVNINASGSIRGGIANQNYGLIENCYVSGTIRVSSEGAGGITGANCGLIRNCYVTANVTAVHDFAGGIAGLGEYFRNPGTIERSYVTGNVSGRDWVGGITGAIGAGSTITNCVVLSSQISATGGTRVGRIVGQNVVTSGNTGTLASNYARESGMTITNNSGDVARVSDAAGIHGESAQAANTHGANSGTWWSTTVGFSANNWTFAASRLPHLRTTRITAFGAVQNPAVQ